MSASKTDNLSVDDLLKEVRAELRRLASERVRISIDRFFTPDQPVDSYGVASPDVKRIAQGVYRQLKPWPEAERDRFCTALWKSGKNEEGALVCYVYRRFAKQCGAREFKLFTRWLDRHVHNWGHTDGLSLWLLGASIANEKYVSKIGRETNERAEWSGPVCFR